eukprot:7031020-Prymnesium_polylepis.1
MRESMCQCAFGGAAAAHLDGRASHKSLLRLAHLQNTRQSSTQTLRHSDKQAIRHSHTLGHSDTQAIKQSSKHTTKQSGNQVSSGLAHLLVGQLGQVAQRVDLGALETHEDSKLGHPTHLAAQHHLP